MLFKYICLLFDLNDLKTKSIYSYKLLRKKPENSISGNNVGAIIAALKRKFVFK